MSIEGGLVKSVHLILRRGHGVCICQLYVIIRFATKVTGVQYSKTENKYITEPVFLLLHYILSCQAQKERGFVRFLYGFGTREYIQLLLCFALCVLNIPIRALFMMGTFLCARFFVFRFHMRSEFGYDVSLPILKTEKSKEYREYWFREYICHYVTKFVQETRRMMFLVTIMNCWSQCQ